ncbi:MAG: hypothetical protein IKI06_06785 [Prevotella sp.]|nr:hypothetical protein [Prevotella sp.]
MNNFNINRFGQTFRWVVATNFRNFIAWTLGAAVGAFLMEMIFVAMNVHSDGGNYVPVLYSTISQICQIALIIFVLVALSTGFADYQKKAKREAFLMLPSTNLEKFLAVVIYVTVVWSLAGFLAFAIGDTLRMAVRALAYGNEWYSLVPKMLDLFGEMIPSYEDGMMIRPISYRVCAPIALIGLFVWLHSTYILGGTLLRKYAFVASSLVIISAFILMAWLNQKYNLQFFYVDTFIDGQSVDALRQSGALDANGPWSAKSVQIIHKVGALGYFITVALPILSIFNYWASFHIFKGFQLITNKWINYDFHK